MKDSNRALEAAEGYISLGLFDEALEELDSLGNGREDPAVMEMRIHILQSRQEWEPARKLAEWMAVVDPGDPAWWIKWAYCLRREKTIHEARGVLWQAAQLHPAEGLIQYNLACYACVLEELDEARRLLAKALAMEPEFREMALTDEDLEPLWRELRGGVE